MIAHVLAVSLWISGTGLPDMNVVAQIESGGNPKAVSHCGAQGLCQILPSTWKEHAKKGERWRNPAHNKRVAKRYMVWIQRTLKKWGDPGWNRTSHILACYNGGIGRFRQCGFRESLMPAETREYLKRYEKLIHPKK
jgi:soluble lytic murein transglycosylase-like protein